MAADLDDAFADFLSEVKDVDAPGAATEPCSPPAKAAPSSPPTKRPRQRDSRTESAEELRKAAYHGDAVKVQGALAGLQAGERLLLIDDLDVDDGFAALHLAVIRGHLGVMKQLIGLRSDVDVLTRDGDTPLMWAAHLGKMKTCKELLQAGADAMVKKKGLKGKTAAFQAMGAGHKRIHDFLENHAFDVAASLQQKAKSRETAADRRRTANLLMLEKAAREAKEKEDEDAFWEAIRARKEGREARGESLDSAAQRAQAASAAEAAQAARFQDKSEEDEMLALPLVMRPHYRELGIEADAEEKDVRKAYKLLALKHHPDKNPQDPAGAKERFTKLAVTYEAICDYLAKQEAGNSHRGARVAPPSNI